MKTEIEKLLAELEKWNASTHQAEIRNVLFTDLLKF